MKTSTKVVAVCALALVFVGSLAACSEDSFTLADGSGNLALFSFLPDPVAESSPFTITGSGFESVVSNDAVVHFRTLDGSQIFAGGTSDVADVPGDVQNDSTITGTTPDTVICTPTGLVGVEVTVTLGSGITSSDALAVQFASPTITDVDQNPPDMPEPDAIPQTIPTDVTVIGTDLGTVGQPVTVRFTGGPGTPYQGGTATFDEVPGTVTSSTTISAITPVVSASVDFLPTVQVFYADGACTPALPNAFLWEAPPQVLNVTNLEPESSEPAAPFRRFLAACSSAMQVDGTEFDPAAVVAVVNNAAPGVTDPIGDGALHQPIVAGATQIVGRTPADTTQVGTVQARVRVTNPDGQFGEFTATDLEFVTSGDLLDVDVSAAAGNQSGPAIAIDPIDPGGDLPHVMAVVMQDPGSANVLSSRSVDGGRTWTAPAVVSAGDGLGAGTRTSLDLEYDAFGNLFLTYLFDSGAGDVVAGSTAVVIARSLDDGASFATLILDSSVVAERLTSPVLATGPDPAGGEVEAVAYLSDTGAFPANLSEVVVAGLTSMAFGFTPTIHSPVVVSDLPAAFLVAYEEPDVGVASDGTVYVSWTQHDLVGLPTAFFLDHDPDGLSAGVGFGSDVTMPPTSEVQFGEPNFASPPEGASAGLRMAVVRAGPFEGRVVFVYTDEAPPTFPFSDEPDNTEVRSFFTDDAGLTFSPVVPVNDVSLNAQQTANVDADPITGWLYATWYDARNDPAGLAVERFGAGSQDGGVTWNLNVRISDRPSDLNGVTEPQGIGRTQGLAVHGGCAVGAWTDNASRPENPDEPNVDVVVSKFQSSP